MKRKENRYCVQEDEVDVKGKKVGRLPFHGGQKETIEPGKARHPTKERADLGGGRTVAFAWRIKS